ncbi:hypothetical protein F4861DRAFT_540510 [Xylaria intraflava]|nr:hypothetical protein F4861DRAFT_540510 [Xylaria intraflava]
MAALPDLPASFTSALELIDAAHAEDPRAIPSPDGTDTTLPSELHYARKMTRWLAVRCPDASPSLQVACRAQHFRSTQTDKTATPPGRAKNRWEIPRDSFPMTRAGYLTWRAKQKTEAAEKIKVLLSSLSPALAAADIDRVAALVRKEGLAVDAETQVLEDVACLVFLDDQLDDFEKRADVDEDKMVNILRKTWAKMSARGREIALGMKLSERATTLVTKALAE